ncbi:uncharacterized protein TNCV_4554571 [Trichonephila clavipes]|nr:uncharacterized protein TNCV_4554571 [Trichonephila clavipes]
MDVCKCRVPSRHGGTLKAASPHLSLMAGDERWEALNLAQGVLPQNWNGTELNRTVTCIVLKATTNGRYASSPQPRLISWASI